MPGSKSKNNKNRGNKAEDQYSVLYKIMLGEGSIPEKMDYLFSSS